MVEAGLTTRLKTFAQEMGLSQSQFADSLDVQRSTMSHLFSGRNKPSISLIVKITEQYPQLNVQWLLHGKGDILIENASKSEEAQQDVTLVNNPASSETTRPDHSTSNTDSIKAKIIAETHLGNQGNLDKKLTQIALIYSDGSVKLVEV